MRNGRMVEIVNIEHEKFEQFLGVVSFFILQMTENRKQKKL
jgi:hypothetical protein